MSDPRASVAIVFPAYNAAATLAATLNELPDGFGHHRILVDDASQDETVMEALRLGLHVVKHARNRGYGGNQKTCYETALETDADIIVMIHPDNQYDARVAPLMVEFIQLGICDVVLGNRIRTRREALDGGMPVWKYFLNRLSTFSENFLLGQSLGDFHSGFRAYSRSVLEQVSFRENSDDFVFDQQFLIQAIHLGFKIGDVPVPVRYMKEASSISFKRSLTYGWGTLLALSSLMLHRLGIRNEPRLQAATID